MANDNTFVPVATGQVVDAIDLVGTGIFSPEMDTLIAEMHERAKQRPLNRYVQLVPVPVEKSDDVPS